MKRGQAWGFDLIVASMLFVSGIVVFYMYSLNSPEEATTSFGSLSSEGKIIADSLLSEGYPSNWNVTSVTRIGLLTNDKINESKLNEFYNLSTSNYYLTKSLFKTKYEYYVSFSPNIQIGNQSIDYIGYKPSSSKNLIRISRFTIYRNQPLTINIYIWE